jgi:hypothetical protein
MKPTKTINTYSEAIRNKYLKDIKSGAARSELYALTPANIRRLCLSLLDEGLSSSDESRLGKFFEENDLRNLRSVVKKVDLGKLKPIRNYLRGDSERLLLDDAVELLAVLVDFQPRPYRNYLKKERNDTGLNVSKDNAVNEENIRDDYETTDAGEVITEVKEHDEKVIVKPKRKGMFHWVSTATAPGRWRIVGVGIVIIAVVILSTRYFVERKTRWMVWDEDHYVEVKFDLQKYDAHQLKIYKQERIDHFKKISVDCSTVFFNSSGAAQIWYGKNTTKTLEFFSAYGLHPETGKTLKPITQYMIDKYVCPTKDE